MNSSQTDAAADHFQQKTGIDLRKYRGHELTKILLALPDFSANTIRIPLVISVLLAALLTVQVEGTFYKSLAAIGGIIFVILHTLLLFSIVYILKLKQSLTTMLQVAVDLSNQAARDIVTLHLSLIHI